jgi:hypothetical protein
MSRTLFFLCLLLVIPSFGCAVSIHPLYSEKIAAHDDNLVGSWVDEPNEPRFSWEVTSPGKGEYWIKSRRYEKEHGRFTYLAQLLKLGDAHYLDLFPTLEGVRTVDQVNLLRLHRFVWVRVEKDTVAVSPIDRAKLTRVLKAGGHGLTWAETDDKLVLTSETPALQKFFRERGSEVLLEPQVYHRKRDGTGKARGGDRQ